MWSHQAGPWIIEATGWQGYDFIVNRTMAGKGKTWLEKSEGGWRWKKVTFVALRSVAASYDSTICRVVLSNFATLL